MSERCVSRFASLRALRAVEQNGWPPDPEPCGLLTGTAQRQCAVLINQS